MPVTRQKVDSIHDMDFGCDLFNGLAGQGYSNFMLQFFTQVPSEELSQMALAGQQDHSTITRKQDCRDSAALAIMGAVERNQRRSEDSLS